MDQIPISSGHASPDFDCCLLALAEPVVLGVLNARITGNAEDAATLLRGYMQDAVARNHSEHTAWALLFSAGMHWTSALLTEVAKHQDTEPAEMLEQIAMNYAVSRTHT